MRSAVSKIVDLTSSLEKDEFYYLIEPFIENPIELEIYRSSGSETIEFDEKEALVLVSFKPCIVCVCEISIFF